MSTIHMQTQTEYNIVYRSNPESGTGIVRQIEMSDLLLQKYRGMSSELRGQSIRMMQMREKKPERPLDWYITMFAKLFSKKPLHEFLLFETDDFMISLDFYDTNVIQLCMGDEANVLEIHTSENRAQSRVVSNVNGSLWEMAFKHGQFTVGRLLEFFNSVPSNGQWAMTSNSGTHFSGRVWHEVRNIVHK